MHMFLFHYGYLVTCRQIWSDYDETVARQAEVEPEEDFGARKPEYIDVIVSDVRTKNGFNFSVQILNTEGKNFKVVSSAVLDFDLSLQESHHWHNSCATFLLTTKARRRRPVSCRRPVTLSLPNFRMVRGTGQRSVAYRPSSARRRSPLSTTATKIQLVLRISAP